jgi:hypothetical protein
LNGDKSVLSVGCGLILRYRAGIRGRLGREECEWLGNDAEDGGKKRQRGREGGKEVRREVEGEQEKLKTGALGPSPPSLPLSQPGSQPGGGGYFLCHYTDAWHFSGTLPPTKRYTDLCGMMREGRRGEVCAIDWEEHARGRRSTLSPAILDGSMNNN